ncbi:hypothetical protein BCY91_06775 [Pelobium manganitolerans]|uniref:YWFCY domain-containing protein n=2 Tax=Pelobium manganitolerans TaxID=1842495 RepID=A0A419S544_9SPHI|nr:hypothetical protein BCY91_06775 [Pelobium manganitolerans]
MLSVAILVIHFYLTCYLVFRDNGLSWPVTDRMLIVLSRMKIFNSISSAKIGSILLLLISLCGAKGRKDEKSDVRSLLTYSVIGLLLYSISSLLFILKVRPITITYLYISCTSVGYILILSSGTRLSRLLKYNLANDVFNKENETFPQEERKLENEYSINLPARYYYKGRIRNR